MRIKFLLRNVFICTPVIYRLYQNYGFHSIRKKVNPYYEKEFKYLKRLLNAGFDPNCIIDVGGNLGQSTLAMNLVFKPTEIIVFEPNPLMAAQCRRMRATDGPKIMVEEIGLGREDSEILLFTPVYNGITFWGLASQNKKQIRAFFGAHNIWNYKSSKFQLIEKSIKIRALDSYHIKPNFIKIDVEGMELEVLAGAEKTIIESWPVLMVECTGTHGEVRKILEAKGYKNFELENTKWVVSQGKKPNQIFLPGDLDVG
jgi:FkbM family methyltransferase